MKETITKFVSSYDRSGYIALSDEHECDCCGNKRLCIEIDSSGDEYGPGKICLQCVNDALVKYYAKVPAKNVLLIV